MSAIPLLVCDDSNMARKQLIRALPANWPFRISQAANGVEGLEAIRQGNGQIVLMIERPTTDDTIDSAADS